MTVQTMTMELRPYQLEARNAIHEEWRKGNKRTLLVLPTGCGKTIVFSKVIEDCVKEGERVLVLAHRTELLDQAADKLEKSTGLKCAVEKAEQTSIGSFYRVVVGSVQTMMRDSRLKQFSPSHFQTVIVDEAHHAVSDSYQKVLNHFNLANVLGVTATPDRGDMRNIGSFFDTLAYEYKLPMAIKQGYLSPIKALTIPLKLDLTNVRQQSGDFAASDLDTALDPYLERIAHEMWQVAKHRKIVVFLPLIATSQRFADILNRIGFKAAEVNGESYDRQQVIRDFEKGRYNVLCNSMLLTEGWDCPSVDCIVVLRPTKSRSLYSQMIGRGTRLYQGKKELLVLDFLWHTERHALSHPAHLIAESDEIAEAMTKRIEEAGEAVAAPVEAAAVEAARPPVVTATTIVRERTAPITGAQYLEANIKAALGDDEARRTVRAADDSTSTNTGLTLPRHLDTFITDTFTGRPAFEASTRAALIDSGMSFTVPRLYTNASSADVAPTVADTNEGAAPSIAVSHTVSGGPRGVDVTVPCLRVTQKESIQI